MKILIIPSWYKNKDNPILGSFFEDQARMLMRHGFEVNIFYPYLSSKKENQTKINDDGLIVFYHPINISKNLYLSQVPPYVHTFKFEIQRDIIKGVKKVFETFGMPDLVHAHSVYLGGVAAEIIKASFGIEYVITEHATFITKPSIYHYNSMNPFRIAKIKMMQSKINKPAVEKVINSAKKLILVSESQQIEINKNYNITSGQHVISNVINPIFFTGTRNEITNPTILSIGNFIKIKNFEFLIQAFNKIVKTHPHIRLHIIGQGPLKKKYLKLKSPNVKITGPVSRLEVKKAIAKSRIVVSTSLYETFGVSIAEAMAMGKSVVVPNTFPLKDFIYDSDKCVYRKGNLNDLIDKMNYHLFHSDQIIVSQNIEIAENEFSEKSVAARLKILYTSLLSLHFFYYLLYAL